MGEPRRRIGGSMIAKILKQSKWGTPLDAYLELIAPEPTQDVCDTCGGLTWNNGFAAPETLCRCEDPDKDRGNFLEPAIRQWTNKRMPGFDFHKPDPGVLVYPEWEWATVSPDGLTGTNPIVTTRPHALLEIKAPRRDDIAQWGEEGSDEVPTDALLQTHWGMLVANAQEGVVAALLGGELRIYRVKRDHDLEAKMLARAKEFVETYVLPGIPPEPTFGDDKNVLYLHPRATKPHLAWDSLTDTQREAVGEYLGAYAEESAAAKRLEAWEPGIKMLIAEHSGVTLPDGRRIDWSERAGTVKWKGVAEELLAEWSPRHAEEEVAALLARHKGEPSRSLRPYEAKKSKK